MAGSAVTFQVFQVWGILILKATMRGLLGFVADPQFASNGRFWVRYSAINERSANPPCFFQWLVSISDPWNMAEYDHVDHIAEYKVVQGVPMFQRTLLKLKRPYSITPASSLLRGRPS